MERGCFRETATQHASSKSGFKMLKITNAVELSPAGIVFSPFRDISSSCWCENATTAQNCMTRCNQVIRSCCATHHGKRLVWQDTLFAVAVLSTQTNKDHEFLSEYLASFDQEESGRFQCLDRLQFVCFLRCSGAVHGEAKGRGSYAWISNTTSSQCRICWGILW